MLCSLVVNSVSIKNTEAIFDCSLVVLSASANTEIELYVETLKQQGSVLEKRFVLNPSNDYIPNNQILVKKAVSFSFSIDLTTSTTATSAIGLTNSGIIKERRWYKEFCLVVKQNGIRVTKPLEYKLFSEKQFYPTLSLSRAYVKTALAEDVENKSVRVDIKHILDELTNYNLKTNPCYYLTADIEYLNSTNGNKENESQTIQTNVSGKQFDVDITDNVFEITSLYKYVKITFSVHAMNNDIITSTSKMFRIRSNYTFVYKKQRRGYSRIKLIGYKDSDGNVYTLTEANIFNIFDKTVYDFVNNLDVVDDCYIEHLEPESNIFTERHEVSITGDGISFDNLIFSFSNENEETDIVLTDGVITSTETYDKIEITPKSKIIARGASGFYCETTFDGKQYKLKFKTKIKTNRHVMVYDDTTVGATPTLYPSDYLAPDPKTEPDLLEEAQEV